MCKIRKLIKISIFLSFFIISYSSYSQHNEVKRFYLKTSIIHLFARQWNINAEYFLDKSFKKSITLSPYVIYWNQRGNRDTLSPIANHRGLGLGLAYKYYFSSFNSKRPFRGLYLIPSVKVEYLSIDFVYRTSKQTLIDNNGNPYIKYGLAQNLQNITLYQSDIAIGYQWLWKQVVFDVYGGIAWRYTNSTFPRGERGGYYYYPNQFVIFPKLGFQVGFAF